MKKMLVGFLILVLLVNSVVAECDNAEIKKDIWEDGQATRKQLLSIEQKFHDTTVNIIREEGNSLLDRFQTTLTENIKITIVYVTLSLFGIMLVVNGIIGYLRLKKESELLLIIAERLRRVEK